MSIKEEDLSTDVEDQMDFEKNTTPITNTDNNQMLSNDSKKSNKSKKSIESKESQKSKESIQSKKSAESSKSEKSNKSKDSIKTTEIIQSNEFNESSESKNITQSKESNKTIESEESKEIAQSLKSNELSESKGLAQATELNESVESKDALQSNKFNNEQAATKEVTQSLNSNISEEFKDSTQSKESENFDNSDKSIKTENHNEANKYNDLNCVSFEATPTETKNSSHHDGQSISSKIDHESIKNSQQGIICGLSDGSPQKEIISKSQNSNIKCQVKHIAPFSNTLKFRSKIFEESQKPFNERNFPPKKFHSTTKKEKEKVTGTQELITSQKDSKKIKSSLVNNKNSALINNSSRDLRRKKKKAQDPNEEFKLSNLYITAAIRKKYSDDEDDYDIRSKSRIRSQSVSNDPQMKSSLKETIKPKKIKNTSLHLYVTMPKAEFEAEKIDFRRYCFSENSQKLTKNTSSLLARERTDLAEVLKDVREKDIQNRLWKEYIDSLYEP